MGKRKVKEIVPDKFYIYRDDCLIGIMDTSESAENCAAAYRRCYPDINFKVSSKLLRREEKEG